MPLDLPRLERAYRDDPSDPEVGERLEELYTERERWADLAALLGQRADRLRAGGEAADAVEIGDLEYRAGATWLEHLGRADEALACFQRAFEADETHARALAAGRRVYTSLGMWAGATSLLALEVAITGDAVERAGLLQRLGEMQWRRLGKLPEAARSLEEAAGLAPEDEAIQLDLGELLSSAEYPGADGLGRAAVLFLEVARRREARGENEAALELLRRALGADPTGEEAFRALEAAHQQDGAWEDLERLYAQRIAVAPDQEASALLMDRADLLLRQLDRQDEARACFEAALPHQGQSGEAAAQLLEIYRDSREWARVVQLLDAQVAACTTLDTQVALKLEISAILRDRLDDPEASGHLIHEVLQLQPENLEAQEAYQSYFRSKGDYGNLVNLQRYLVSQQRQAGRPAQDVCALLEEVARTSARRLGDLEGAVEAWQQVEELQPESASARKALERLGARMHSWQQKVQALEQEAAGAVSQTQRVQALRRMAKVYFEWQVDPERTRAILQEILDLSASDEHALRMRVDICEREADFAGLAEALAAQLDGMMTTGERISILRRIGDLHGTKLDNPGRALDAYQSLLELSPADYRVQERVLRLLEQTDDLAGQVRFLEQRAQTSRSMARRVEALQRLALIARRELSDSARASGAYEQILTLDPDNLDALEALADLYGEAGRLHDLLALLQRRLALLPERPVATRAALLGQIAELARDRLELPGDAVEAFRQRAGLLPADRITREALVRLLGQLGRHREMVEVLGELLELSDEPEARVVLALRQADLLEGKLDDRQGAAELLERVLERDAPGDRDLHLRLKGLQLALGDTRRACELAERELVLFGGEPRETRDLALGVARMWRRGEGETDRAALAYERALALEPGHLEAQQELYELYREAGAPARQARAGAALLGGLSDPADQLALIQELGRLHEQGLQDPAAAFGWLHRAHELTGNAAETGKELERLAAEHGLWEQLTEALREQRRHEQRPEFALEITLRVAEIRQEEMADPDGAFEELVQGMAADSAGLRVLPRLKTLATTPALKGRLLDVYRQLAEEEEDTGRRRALLRKEAAVAEEELSDPARALAALAALDRLEPGLEWLPGEAERLAEAAGRWDEVLEIHGGRIERAERGQRVELLGHVAEILEERAERPADAFRAHLQALALAPAEERIEENLWRLARLLDGDLQVVGDGDLQEVGDDNLQVVDTDDLRVVDTDDLRAVDTDDLRAVDTDDLREVDTDDLREVGTGDLEMVDTGDLEVVDTGDLEVVDTGDMDVTSQEEELREVGTGDLLELDIDELEVGDVELISSESEIDPWAELAGAYRDLPAPDPAGRVGWLLQEARVWRQGAGDVQRTLEVLAEASAIDPEHPEVMTGLESLCHEAGRPDDLIRILCDAVELSRDADQLLRLELKVSGLLLQRGREPEAEQHLGEALKVDPGCAEAEAQLAGLLQRQERGDDLASLLARQLRALEQTLEEAELDRRLLELADLHQERLEQPEDAARYLARLDGRPGASPELRERLANLLQELGEWADLVQVLEKICAESLETGDRPAALAALRRLARVQQDELELPDRAVEAYRRLLEHDPADRAALAALSELYATHERVEDLCALLEGWVDLAGEDLDEARPLLLRLARLVEGEDPEAAVVHLQRARALGAADSELDDELTALLLRSDRGEEAAALLRERLELARERGAEAGEEAGLLLRQADVLDASLGRVEEAWRCLAEARELSPDGAETLDAVARHHWRHEQWAAHADALERSLEAAPERPDADDVLMAAAGALEERAGDPARARQLYQRVLDQNPEHLDALDAVVRLCSQTEGELAEALLRRKEGLVEDPRSRGEALSDLADLRLRQGADLSEVEDLFQQALELCDDLPAALDGLSRLLLEQDRLDAARLLLEDALTRLSGGVVSGLLGMRLGEVYQRLGRHNEAFTFLLEAHRKDPDDQMLRLAVGLNRYHLERWQEALGFLEPLLEGDAADVPRADLAEAMFAGGRSAAALGQPERARPLLQAALAAYPEHDGALSELAFLDMDAGQWERAAAALDRLLGVTTDADRRRDLLRLLGDLRRERLEDPPGAADCYEELHGLLGDDDATRLEMLPVMLPVMRVAGRHAAGAAVAEDLAALLDDPRQSSALLLAAAGARLAAGQPEVAAERWREVLRLDPESGVAVEGLSRHLLEQGEHEEAAQLAGGYVTGRPAAPTAAGRSRRSRLLELLARAFSAQGKLEPALAALEEALEVRGEDLGLLEQVGELYARLPDSDPDAVLRNHRRVLALDGARAAPLAALAAASMRTSPDQARALYQALALLGALDGAGEAYLAGYCPAELDLAQPFAGQLIEDDREALGALSQPAPLEELFQLIWAQAPTLFPDDPAEAGLAAEEKAPPMGPSPPALAFSAAARALGRTTAQLYLVDPHHPLAGPCPRVVAMASPAVVASPAALEELQPAELLFQFGRALELTGPPGVLAAGVEPEQFVHLMLRVLRAFHPRHMRGRKDLGKDALEEASLFRRALPFKVARRLGELFRELEDHTFDSARWRQGAWHGANRAGLLLCGDLDLAARIIRAEEGLQEVSGDEAVRRSATLRDLISFVAGDAYPRFRRRLIA